MAKRSDEIELILQDCLGKIQNGQETLEGVLARYPEYADELRPALESALWLRSHKEGLEPRPGYISASRRRLVEQIKQEQAAVPLNAGGKWGIFWQTLLQAFQTRRAAFQFVTALVLVIALVSGSAGIARAAQYSLPGESLFPVKLAIEEAQVILTPDDAAKASQQIERAQQRLFEIESLLVENQEEQIAASVKLFEDQVNTTVRSIIQVQDQDPEKAKHLASSLTNTLSEQYDIIRALTSTASPVVAADLDRLLQVTGSVIGLVQETVPVETEPALVIATPESSTTPSIVQVVPSSTPLVLATPRPALIPSLTQPGMSIPIFELTETLTATLGIISDDDETEITPSPLETEEVKPVKEPKPTKDKKDKKDKKELPEPTRRPPKPNR